MNLIEQLKHNKTAFGLLEPEERECFEKVGAHNCQEYGCGGDWHCVSSFYGAFVYQIRADYQPKPQTERCEVIVEPKCLLYSRIGRECKYLTEAFSDPEFSDFLDKNGMAMSIRGPFPNTASSRYKRDFDIRVPAPIPKYVLFVKRPK